MPRTIKGPPGQLRLRLGQALSQARRALKLSQAEAARAAGTSQSMVSSIENGMVEVIKPEVINNLISLYEIEETAAEELRYFARQPHGFTGSWSDTTVGPTWWQEHAEIEDQAVSICAFHLQAWDGLLQCPAYMLRQFELAGTPNIASSVALRTGRQEAWVNRPVPPQSTFVLDEACFHKDMGDPDVLVAQIEHALHEGRRPFVSLRVLPFGAAFPASTYGFTLLRFASVVIGDFVSIEYEVGSATIEDPTAVMLYMARWDALVKATLSEEDSREFMIRRLDQLKMR